MHTDIARRLPHFSLLAVGTLLFVTAWMMPVGAVWVTDSGNRRIQAESLIDNRFQTTLIRWPGVSIDPALRYFPTGGHHFLTGSGAASSFYSPVYPALTAPLLAFAGARTTVLFSALAAILAVAFTSRIAAGLRGSSFAVATTTIAVGLATPLWFYASVYWEHALAVALSTGGMFLLLSRIDGESPPASRMVAAGLLVASSAWLREEGYVAGLALAVALFAVHRRIRPPVVFSAAFGAGMLPLWVFNLSTTGSPLGIHSVVYSSMPRDRGLSEMAGTFLEYLGRSHPSVVLSALLAAPALFILLARAMPAIRRFLPVLIAFAGVAAATMAFWQFRSPDPIRATLWTQGLLPGVPWVAVALALGTRRPPILLLSWAVGVGTFLTPLLLHRGDVGIIWGPRHFLWLIPPAVALAVHGAFESRSGPMARGSLGILLAGCIALQLAGINALTVKTRHGARTIAALESNATPIVTDVFWLPEELAALWMRTPIFFVTSDEELTELRRRLREAGVGRWRLVLSRTQRSLTQHALAETLASSTKRTRVASENAESLDLMIVEIAEE